jgi:hypothetical protein
MDPNGRAEGGGGEGIVAATQSSKNFISLTELQALDRFSAFTTIWGDWQMRRSLAFVLFCFLLSAVPAKADTLYTYTSDMFTIFSGDYDGRAITGSFVLSDAFTRPAGTPGTLNVTDFVTAFSFTDGVKTFTKENAITAQFSISTIGTNETLDDRTSWAIVIGDGTGGISTQHVYGAGWNVSAYEGPFSGWYNCSGLKIDPIGPVCVVDSSQTGELAKSIDKRYGGGHGTWTIETVPTPEPSTLLLFSIGLVGLGALRLSRSQRSASPGR